ncbi:hypothetical protein EV702DRAFT_1050800 [Suillus placidus]|uniref:Uncharacterized protein n=1 Tax=Suillus placidus TaxID=48579 RepID=A0A9P7CWP5_9AGAM|nr:hypothetical protein EV702DRAFT_1050800 [Suillus placidus]
MIEHYTSTSFDGLSSDDKQGATAPLTDIDAEDLSASLYINPKLLAQHTECHQTIAQITQLFIEGCALPVAQSFCEARLAHGWRQDLQSQPVEHKYDAIPLIPLPSSGTHSSDFDILGRPVGCLDHIFATRATTDSMVPFSSIPGRLSSVCWINQQVPLSSHTSLVVRDSTDNLVNQLRHVTIRRFHPIIHHTISGHDYSLNAPNSGYTIHHAISFHFLQPEFSVMPVSTPATGRITNWEPGGSSSYPSPGRLLRSFRPSTQLALQALGYGDVFHKVCRDVFDNFVTENWVSELAKRGFTIPDHAEQISAAMWDDSCFLSMVHAVFLSSRRRLVARHGCKKAPKLSREARLAITTRQRANEDAAVDKVLTYIDEQATELAQWFGRSRRHYLEKIFISSPMQREWHNKTSSWSMYLHFKEEYHQLTLEQHSEMVEEFNKIKSSRQSKPPNVTARTHLAEVNHSFAAMVSESSIQNGLNQSLVEVTEDQNATLEFVCYEWMVQAHLVKIVGWCHDHWGNPSNLKGSVDALQTLALAIDNRTCWFVKISKDEAIKRMERIDAGEDLSPNKVDTEPYKSDNNRDSNNNDGDGDNSNNIDNDNDIDININNSNGNSNNGDGDNSNGNSNGNNRDGDNSRDRENDGSVGNSVPTGEPRSKITDDLIDPVL